MPLQITFLSVLCKKKAFDIVKSHYFEQDSSHNSQLLLIILGEGGTGKSYLINSLRRLLQNRCVVSAPTGKAAFNVKGLTLHSLLKLPVGSKRHNDLTGQSLIQLQEQLEVVDYLIIGEYSMLGQRMFGWVDRQLVKKLIPLVASPSF